MHTDQPIYYTFTVPDEPLDFYRKYNWRKASEEFFEKFPSSAFLELTRGKYEKEFGKWSFPQSYFARSVMFTNEPALVLHRWKVLDFADPYTNRVITRIYYNTTEDLIAAARKAGRDTLLLYGPEWGYIKPGWEQGDFVDCRIMGESASVDLYNFKSGSYGGFLEISAVAMGQAKIVSMNGESVQFPPGEVWCVTIPLTLQPGKNTIPFTSPTAGSLFILDLHWTTETP
ncbi:MAG: hypothetical protein MUC65_10600 [Pontiellaceae bacterium]|nr:hypothetical protein [Pontiellaceae bacterium]